MISKRLLKTAIIKTLVYADLFDYPLTKDELWQRLQLESQPAYLNQKLFTDILEKEVLKGKLNKETKFYFLPNRRSICQLRQRRQKWAKAKSISLQKFTKWAERLPSIRLLAVSGGLAMENTHKNDDIDLLIITARKRLWLTRFLLIMIAESLSIRRRPKDKRPKDKICLNIFLDESALKIPLDKRTLYTAHEMIQIKPIVVKEKIYERFLATNSNWIKKFLPNSSVSKNISLPEIKRSKNKVKEILRQLLRSCFDFLEMIIYKLQFHYMKPRLTRETISASMAFFHPRDTGKEVLQKFENRLAVALER